MASYKPAKQQGDPAFFSLLAQGELARTTDRKPLQGSRPRWGERTSGQEHQGIMAKATGSPGRQVTPKEHRREKPAASLTHTSKDREMHTLPLARLRAGCPHTHTLVHTQQ